MDLTSLYIYALYWVLTVMTTVGYGHLSLYSNLEMLYACFLEVMATIVQAFLIILMQTWFNMNQYSFKQLLFERMT